MAQSFDRRLVRRYGRAVHIPNVSSKELWRGEMGKIAKLPSNQAPGHVFGGYAVRLALAH
jgi:hypothetical protein